jgi:putrescine aminotransferase
MRDFQKAIAYSNKWLEIIKQESATPDEATARWISEETKTNFVNHFNAGWVEYRKSMTEAGDYAAIEWRGERRQVL